MSVLCCYVPGFLLNIFYRRQPQLVDQPLGLLGPDETIHTCSTIAQQCGVRRGMTPQQAQMRCPDLHLYPLDLATYQAEQTAFLNVLADWELPVEEQSWGAAYVDFHAITQQKAEIRLLAADLGRQMRSTLGDALQPALGWDHGKFTSRAAAVRTAPGRMKLVNKSDEVPFLTPLPTALLPLPPATLQRLQWLGISTMGEFARLPSQAVLQQFGKLGVVAQQYAKGRDDRPVRNSVRSLFAPIQVAIDPPTVLIDPVVETLLHTLQPHLQAMADHLEGCRRLNLQLTFSEGDARQVEILCLEPIAQPPQLHRLIVGELKAVNWPGELSAVAITTLERGELPMQQLALLPEVQDNRTPLAGVVDKLKERYGPIFGQGTLVEPGHPVSERRFHFVT